MTDGQPPEASLTDCLPALIHGIIDAQLGADDLDRVLLALVLQAVVVRPAGLRLGDPFVGELAGLDLAEDLASSLPWSRGDDHAGPRVRSPYSAVSEIE